MSTRPHRRWLGRAATVCVLAVVLLLVQPLGMPAVYAGEPGTISFQWVEHHYAGGTIQPEFQYYVTNNGVSQAHYYVRVTLTSPSNVKYTDMVYFMFVNPGQTQFSCNQMDNDCIASFESGTWTFLAELINYHIDLLPIYDTASTTFTWSSSGAPPAVTEEPAPEIHWVTSTPFPEFKVGE